MTTPTETPIQRYQRVMEQISSVEAEFAAEWQADPPPVRRWWMKPIFNAAKAAQPERLK